MLNRLADDIRTWGVERNFPGNATPVGQAKKLVEEATEAVMGAASGNQAELADAIGDTFVVLVLLAQAADLSLTTCIADALAEIQTRSPEQGKWVNGAWVKGSK